ncbi:MAG: glycosyltransferase family protein [Thaumarchaeota archaeon]|nr:glycosyltransferase family protein [Nitrososphaerota archaeon]MBI3641318.1 glycosyltransferase family protein [Nitrososphaerota archaeon]
MIKAIIQARMGSTRLPGKVMMLVKNKPLLYYVINQVKHSTKLSEVIVATTELKEDDQIVNYVSSLGVNVFRGNAEDVLDRYYWCAKKYSADIIVRITSDCPLIDPEIIDKSIDEFKKNNLDYFSNINKKENGNWIYHQSGYPLGFAVEVFTFDILEKCWKNAKKPSEREHVTQYILNNPDLFKIGNMENSEDLSDMRLTVDHKTDLDLVKIIIDNFQKDKVFKMNKISSFLNQNPKLKQINANIPFNEGYLKSLKEDKLAEKA